MNYWIISVTWQGAEARPLDFLFTTPFQAQTHIPKIRSHTGYKYDVRPATWREREARMFLPGPIVNGEAVEPVYKPPIWADERWWTGCEVAFKDHFVHISLQDPDTIAFTEDEAKGEADRQTLMKPGKYLQKFLGAGLSGTIEHGPLKGEGPRVTKMQVAYYAAWHKAGKRPPSDDVLAFTDDPDEIVRVYEDGPESCMMGKGWDTATHPVRVYAGGELKMAYLTSTADEVVARALCWPDKEVFGRVYPTVGSDAERDKYEELMTRLKALGWTSITENNNVFEGALLRRIEGRWGGYIMPYLDNDYGVEEARHEGEWWWRMTHSEHHQDNTDGTYNPGEDNEPDWACDHCGDGFSDSYDSTCVYNCWVPSATGRRGSGYGRGENYFCEACRDDDAWFCDGSDEYYVDSADRVDAENGCTYEANWFEANGGWQCSHSQSYYFKADDPPVMLADGSLIHEDHVDDETFVCQATGLRWLNLDQSSAVPGYHWDFDDDTPHPVEVERTLPALPEDPPDVAAWAAGLTAHLVPAAQADLFIPEPVEVIDISKMAAPVIRPISIDELYNQLNT